MCSVTVEARVVTRKALPEWIAGRLEAQRQHAEVDTLNFIADGLAVTILGNVITAAGRAPVTFTNFEFVNILNASGGGNITLINSLIAGNHDNQNLVNDVYRPVLGALGMHVVGTPKTPTSPIRSRRCSISMTWSGASSTCVSAPRFAGGMYGWAAKGSCGSLMSPHSSSWLRTC